MPQDERKANPARVALYTEGSCVPSLGRLIDAGLAAVSLSGAIGSTTVVASGRLASMGHVSTQEFREFKQETRDRFGTLDEKLDEVAEGVAYLRGRQEK